MPKTIISDTSCLIVLTNIGELDLIGVIIKAKINGIIPSIRPILAKIKGTDFRLSADIERQALLAAGEL